MVWHDLSLEPRHVGIYITLTLVVGLNHRDSISLLCDLRSRHFDCVSISSGNRLLVNRSCAIARSFSFDDRLESARVLNGCRFLTIIVPSTRGSGGCPTLAPRKMGRRKVQSGGSVTESKTTAGQLVERPACILTEQMKRQSLQPLPRPLTSSHSPASHRTRDRPPATNPHRLAPRAQLSYSPGAGAPPLALGIRT